MNHDPAAAQTVSVVMATYNGGRYVADQIDSIAKQTVRPAELLISDDRSTDGTFELAVGRARDSGLDVHPWRNAERLGFARNFIAAAQRASGDLIAFCDQDDVWMPTKLSICVNAFRSTRVALVVHDADLVDEVLVPLDARFPHIERASTTTPTSSPLWPVVPGFAMVYRKSVLGITDWSERVESPRHAGQMVHDEWVYFVAAAVGDVVWIPNRLALHREHQQNATGKPSVSRGWTVRVERARSTGSNHYSRLSALAAQRASLLRESHSPEFSIDLERRASVYDLASDRYQARARLHDADFPLARRIRDFGWLVATGAYRHGSADLGPRAAAKDFRTVGAAAVRSSKRRLLRSAK
jgi:glycosyltransferase involved in cell wall biosynthesis